MYESSGICKYSVVSIKRTGCNKRTGGKNSPKIVKRTGFIKQTGWTFCQKQLSKQGFFYQLKAILHSKTCQYHGFNYKPDYISLRKQENCIKRHTKKENAKKYQRSGWNFFQKQLSEQDLITANRVVKNFKIVKRSCSLNRYYRVNEFPARFKNLLRKECDKNVTIM